MRQGQHSKKNRGRGRRQANPVNRVYESNGPDVKIRGNASHISEKYMALSRDALASGDPVSAENYLQHAEHYLRIIAAASAQQQQNQQQASCAPEDAEQEAQGDNGSGRRSHRQRGPRTNGSGETAAPEKPIEVEAAADQPKAGDGAGNDAEKSAEEKPAEERRVNGSGSVEAPEQTASGADGEAKAEEAPKGTDSVDGADQEVRDAG